MIPLTRLIGGFMRWLFKACKTNLQDEVEGNLDATWAGTYDTENYIIGVLSVSIVLGIMIWIFF